jgi:hypothetical protein
MPAMRSLPRSSSRLLCFIAIFPAAIGPARGEERLSFNTHIQPILSEYCYHCHGPDSGTRKPTDSPLRLDREEFAFLAREHGKPSILKGNPAESDIVRRMRSTKESEIMPPPESHKKMKEEEIALIERWIQEGAEYEDHWSFIPPQKHPAPEPPAHAPDEWKQTAADAFLLSAMTKAGLSPNPPEEKSRLLRRVTFDLTGLPPTPEETAAFLADTSPDAYEKVVDRLLASPRYGEHMARHWLDAARYADTHGIHIDNYRSIWPYRDWVIEAINKNMPFDQFTIEQIAGDLLPAATLDQKIATGFNRCLPTTGEGGAIAEEYDAIYAKDRVETTSGVWLGLTMGCAACHDHKFDPVSMKDFYAFAAFFKNTPMNALDRNQADHPPNIFAPRKEDRAAHADILARISSTRASMAEREKSARADFETWLAGGKFETVEPDRNGLHLHLPLSGEGTESIGRLDGAERKWDVPGERTDGLQGKALLIKEGTDIALGDAAKVDHKDKFSYGALVRFEAGTKGTLIGRMNSFDSFRGWDLAIDDGHVHASIVHNWPDNANRVVSKRKLDPGRWYHVLVAYDGSKRPGMSMTLYIDGRTEAVDMPKKNLAGTIGNDVPLRIGRREPGASGDNRLQGGSAALQDFRFYRRLLSASEISALAQSTLITGYLALPKEQRAPEKEKPIFEHYLAVVDPVMADLRGKLAKLEAEEKPIRDRGSVTLVMEERKDKKPVARIFERGDYSKPGAEVAANVPADLPPLADGQPANRLGLARWLVDRSNPLTARVTVNRVWHQFFGTGIVETTEDFGIMGARPSHPELLDTLAVEFMDSGWNMKELSRRMVLTAAYRQSARTTPEKLEKDPRNRLLARAPRVRLDAEPLRDLALFSSGLMVDKLGGPSVKPYQPEGVWEAVAMHQSNTRHYKQDKGEALYRRSLYTFWKRTAPHPAMETLNAPTREVFCTRRERTNTPLQALVLMNDPQFVEACRALAARSLKESGQTDSRLDSIALRLLARPPDDRERAVLKSSLDDFITTFRSEPDEAKKLISIGATPPPTDADPAELAAWTLVASQILNMDECVTR